jgi:hypothetical protein
MPVTLAIHESLVIDRPPEAVWDFTQDFAQRSAWDPAIRRARVVVAAPVPRVEVEGAAGFKAVLQYRQFERPLRTSLAMEEIRSPLIVAGGGSWSYERVGASTRWTQTNTLVLRDGLVAKLAAPLLRWQFERATRRAMQRAKTCLERSARPGGRAGPPRS